MYIELINCEYVHIYDKTAFAYTADSVCAFDEFSTKLISILKIDSAYDTAIRMLEMQMKLNHKDTVNLVNEIIEVNHRFLIKSDRPNKVMITGHLSVRFPSLLQISLTNKCVHRCRHCFKKCDSNGSTVFPPDVLIALLNQVKKECKFIEFTGGEPLLYPQIMNIVDSFHELFHIHITTSGYSINKFSISDLKMFEMIQISLHGSTAATHDSFVGKKGSFHIVTNNIRWLCANNINVVVSRSLQTYDKNELNNFIRLCIDLGVKRIIFGIIIPVGRAIETKCATRCDEYTKILTFLKCAREKYTQIDIVIDEEHTLSKQQSIYMFHCIGGRLHLYINENGDVFPCPYCQESGLSLGNMIIEPDLFEKIIYHAQYDTFNKKVLNRNWDNLQVICPNIRKPELPTTD